MTIATINSYEPDHGRDTTLWMSAALVVCALHVGLAATYLLLKPEPEARAEAPAFDVAFVPATTATAPAVPETQQANDPPAELPPTPQAVVPEPDPPPIKEEATVQPDPEPAPPVMAEALVQPEPTPLPLALSPPELPVETSPPEQIVLLPPAETKPPAVLPPPPEKAIAPLPERATRKPVPEAKEPKDVRKPPPKAVVGPEAKPARVAMAPNPGQDSDGAREGRASWLSEFIAHMRRFNSHPGIKESGTVSVRVTLDRNGRVLSRGVVSSSGSTALDRIAVELIERAQPFPRFPASMTQAQLVQVIPLHLRPQ